ncbi:MAG: hypothetical protein JW936_10305 [Sedimentisphaerales bacterium]|nr:hypothetical protein [Sedimentisphaerales bacterium]
MPKGYVRNSSAKIIIIATLALSFQVGCADADITVRTAFQNRNVIQYQFPAEYNDQITASKELITSPGSMVYFYLHNDSAEPVSLDNIRWDGGDLQTYSDSYQLIWHRLMPDPIAPGGQAEISLCLRSALTEPTDFVISMTNGTEISAVVNPVPRDFRIQTLRFNSNLDTAYLYIQRKQADAALPEIIFLNGARLGNELTWLNDEYTNDLRVAEVTFDQPLQRGTIQTFMVASADGTIIDATTIRAFGDRAIFGTYGFGDLQRYADNGVNGFNSFVQTSGAALDQAQQLRLRILSMTGGNPNADTIGHPAIYAFGLTEEPDCQDFSAYDRPMHLRIGANAPSVVQMEANCRVADPLSATALTVDLTFTPYNYFIYAPIVDIPNPDCYPISNAWPISETVPFATTMAQTAAPNPFTFTYQGSWEEFAIPQDHWIGPDELREGGFERYRDPCRVRGMGRKPVPSEVRISMLYAVGCGATGLWSYIDSSEAGGVLLFHGSDVLPEIWDVIGRTSRELTSIASLISVAHAATWAASDTDTIWIRTLLAGRDGAVVIAVNDDYSCTPAGFEQNPANNVAFQFDDLPWLRPQMVYRVAADQLVPVPAQRNNNQLNWTDNLGDAEIYLILSDADSSVSQ